MNTELFRALVRRGRRGLILAATIALAAEVPALTLKGSPVGGTIVQGGYIVAVRYKDSAGVDRDAGCMILGQQGTNLIPTLYKWSGSGAYCNLDSASPQALWNIYPLVSNAGVVRHVIKSRINGKCLIRGSNGKASTASMYLWPGGDPHFCGFGSADELVTSGQAAWDFSALQAYMDESADIVYAGQISVMKDPGQLIFGPTPHTWPSTEPDYSQARFTSDPAAMNSWYVVLYSELVKPAPVAVTLK
jgi:hypothetical protein